MRQLSFFHLLLAFSIFSWLSSCIKKPNYYHGVNKSIVRFDRIDNVIAFRYKSEESIDKLNLREFEKLRPPLGKEYDFESENIKFLKIDANYKSKVLETLEKANGIDAIKYVFKTKGSNYVSMSNEEISIGFKESIPLNDVQNFIDKNDFIVLSRSKRFPHFMTISSKGYDIFNLANRLHNSKLVLYAHPNILQKMKHHGDTNGLNKLKPASLDLAFKKIGIDKAWTINKGEPTTSILVIDNGIDSNHRHFSSNFKKTYNTVPGEIPEGAHGTQMAGLALGKSNQNGICQHCALFSIKANNNFSRETAQILRDSIFDQVDVIVISWSFDNVGNDLYHIIKKINEEGRNGKGAVTVYALGNHGQRTCKRKWISSIKSVITVGGSSDSDGVDPNTNYGSCLDVVAPSFSIWAPSYDEYFAPAQRRTHFYENSGNTSAANALVGGVCGLILSEYPNLKSSEVKDLLEVTAQRLLPNKIKYTNKGFNAKIGYGRINAYNALIPGALFEPCCEKTKKNKTYTVLLSAFNPNRIKSISWNCNSLEHPLENEPLNVDDAPITACIKIEDVRFDQSGNKMIQIIIKDINNSLDTINVPLMVY